MKTAILLTILSLEQGCIAHVAFTGLSLDKYPCKPENLIVCLI